MAPGEIVSVAPDPDDVPPRDWPGIDPVYCRAVELVEINAERAKVRTLDGAARICEVPAAYLRTIRTELFPEKAEGTRAVVYLDQNIVSELVKHRRGELKGRNAEVAERLANAIDRAVLVKQTAICLESASHQIESSGLVRGTRPGGSERFRMAQEFLAIRSRGLDVRPRSEQVRFQIHQLAALRSGGVVYRPEHLWKLGLSRNPERSNAQTGVFDGEAVMSVAWKVLEAPPSTAHLLEAQRKVGGLGDFADERRDVVEMLRQESALAFVGLLPTGADSAPARAGIRAVLEGDAFEEIPFVDLKSRLVASLLAEKDRRFRDSDRLDLDAVALALPFCHLMILDRNVHERIRRHRLDTRYGTTVFSSKLADYDGAARWLDNWVAAIGSGPARPA